MIEDMNDYGVYADAMDIDFDEETEDSNVEEDEHRCRNLTNTERQQIYEALLERSNRGKLKKNNTKKDIDINTNIWCIDYQFITQSTSCTNSDNLHLVHKSTSGTPCENVPTSAWHKHQFIMATKADHLPTSTQLQFNSELTTNKLGSWGEEHRHNNLVHADEAFVVERFHLG
jgi:hypothetical protein